jgi:hypothetical protein
MRQLLYALNPLLVYWPHAVPGIVDVGIRLSYYVGIEGYIGQTDELNPTRQ